MKNVIFTETLAGVDFVYHAGQTYEIEEKRAAKWITAGLCRTADAKPKMERAEAKPKPVPRKRRTKKVEE